MAGPAPSNSPKPGGKGAAPRPKISLGGAADPSPSKSNVDPAAETRAIPVRRPTAPASGRTPGAARPASEFEQRQQQTAKYISGRTTAVSDSSGRVRTVSGDSSGRVKTVGDSSGKMRTIGDSSGKLRTVGDSSGKMRTVGDSSGRMATIGGSSGKLRTVDSSGRLSTVDGGHSTRKRLNREELEAQRKALGLDSVPLSDRIQGLDQAAARADNLAAREEEKRRAGGAALRDKAVLTDGTGRRWSLMVLLGLAGIVAVTGLFGAGMWWFSNRETVDTKAADRDSQDRLARYAKLYRPMMKPFPDGEPVTADEFRTRMKEAIEAQIAQYQKAAEAMKAARGTVDQGTRDKLKQLEADLGFIDAYGKPIEFERDGENVIMRVSRQGVKPQMVTVPYQPAEEEKKK